MEVDDITKERVYIRENLERNLTRDWDAEVLTKLTARVDEVEYLRRYLKQCFIVLADLATQTDDDLLPDERLWDEIPKAVGIVYDARTGEWVESRSPLDGHQT